MISKTVLISIAPTAIALLAGAIFPFQAASSAGAGRALGNPLWGALSSLAVSIVVITTMLLVTRAPAPAFSNAIQGPWWFWISGFLGALYVASAAALTPKLGAAGFLMCVVAGQIVASVLVDHFGLMGLVSRPMNSARLGGIALILIGVFLVQSGHAIAPDHYSRCRQAA